MADVSKAALPINSSSLSAAPDKNDRRLFYRTGVLYTIICYRLVCCAGDCMMTDYAADWKIELFAATGV